MIAGLFLGSFLVAAAPKMPDPLFIGVGQFYSNRRRIGGRWFTDTGLIHDGQKVWIPDEPMDDSLTLLTES